MEKKTAPKTEEKKKVEATKETAPVAATTAVKASKKRVDVGILSVQSTYNNTLATLSDAKGNALAQSSAGALGFKGAKKGTPFAAAKVGEELAIKAQAFGIKEVSVVIKGVGSGRESVVRSFVGKGFGLTKIVDATPVPHNGPKPPRPRRV